jgi:hypothetical protein
MPKQKRTEKPGIESQAHFQGETMPSLSLPRFEGKSRLLIFPLCVFEPASGLTLAAIYLAQQDRLAKRFGWICLVLALLGAAARGSRGGGYGESLTQPFY